MKDIEQKLRDAGFVQSEHDPAQWRHRDMPIWKGSTILVRQRGLGFTLQCSTHGLELEDAIDLALAFNEVIE